MPDAAHRDFVAIGAAIAVAIGILRVGSVCVDFRADHPAGVGLGCAEYPVRGRGFRRYGVRIGCLTVDIEADGVVGSAVLDGHDDVVPFIL